MLISAKNSRMPKIQTVFITVDPERDDPKTMQTYCEGTLINKGINVMLSLAIIYAKPFCIFTF